MSGSFVSRRLLASIAGAAIVIALVVFAVRGHNTNSQPASGSSTLIFTNVYAATDSEMAFTGNDRQQPTVVINGISNSSGLIRKLPNGKDVACDATCHRVVVSGSTTMLDHPEQRGPASTVYIGDKRYTEPIPKGIRQIRVLAADDVGNELLWREHDDVSGSQDLAVGQRDGTVLLPVATTSYPVLFSTPGQDRMVVGVSGASISTGRMQWFQHSSAGLALSW